MSKINVIGLDLAKNVIQVHGVSEDGEVFSFPRFAWESRYL